MKSIKISIKYLKSVFICLFNNGFYLIKYNFHNMKDKFK